MLVIEEELLLQALVRALCVVKFDCPPELGTVGEVAGSPLVAEVARRAYDALVTTYRNHYQEGEAHRLEQGRRAEQMPLVLAVVQAHIRSVEGAWVSWTREEKGEYVRILLSPYTAGPELIHTIVADADAVVAGGS
jgi:hypothetical protein